MNEPQDREKKNGVTQPSVQGAGFVIRGAAHLVDFALLMMLVIIGSIPFLIRVVQMKMTAEEFRIPLWLEIPLDILLAAGLIMLWRWTQTTPGKKLFGLRIVDSQTGSRPSWGKLVARYFAYLLAAVPIPLRLLTLGNPDLGEDPVWGHLMRSWATVVPLGLGFWWILVDSRNRGWHDLLSGTVVVRDLPKKRDIDPLESCV